MKQKNNHDAGGQHENDEKAPNMETLKALREAEAGELAPLDLEQLQKDMTEQ